ncbi:MAG: GAF domain-containing sensor histidine kinase [Bryobacteraceae bacterium]
MIAKNVDQLTHNLARQFLQEIRVAIQDRRLVVVLTGEHDLERMVHGPNSELDIDGRYVIQGFALDEFSRLLLRDRYTSTLRLEPIEETAKDIWSLTGGNTDLLRTILIALEDHRLAKDTGHEDPVATEWLSSWLQKPETVSQLAYEVLRHAIRLIPQAPDTWGHFETLIANGKAELSDPTFPPGPLTLSGIAIRDKVGLEFCSDLMARTVRYYFDQRRLGDLYAGAGRWQDAMAHYRRMSHAERQRPTTAFDRKATERTVSILGSQMHSAAHSSAEEVRRSFKEGCQFALGFPDVFFWRRRERWEPVADEDAPREDCALATIRELLVESDSYSTGEVWPIQPRQGAVLGTRLHGIWADQPLAVLIGDFKNWELLSRERIRVARELLDQFRQAHDYATGLQRERMLLKLRQTVEDITKEIIQALGSQILDVDGVLKCSAQGLRKLGYRRMFFSLVDPKEQYIVGAWDECADEGFKLTSHSRWLLDDAHLDIQPYVVRTKKPVIVADAATHPLTNKRVVEPAGLRAFALIPLIGAADRVIGTLHLERDDLSLPSDEEVQELFQFGKTITALIQHGERIHLLQSSTDAIPEPLLIIDPRRRVRYANATAVGLFPELAPAGWRLTCDEGEPFAPKNLGDSVEEALNGGTSIRHVHSIGADPEYDGAVGAQPVRNYGSEIVGALVHIEDLNYFYRVVDALGRAAQAVDRPSAMERLLQATRTLGHQWGRLYLLQDGPPPVLVSQQQFGFAAESEEGRQFEQGICIDSPRSQFDESWTAIELGVPVVFCYTGRDECFKTDWGLPVRGVASPHCSGILRKRHGDYWIDLPLLAGPRKLGKISLQCHSNLRPDHLDFLKEFAAVSSLILHGFVIREGVVALQEREAERALAQLSHSLGTKIAWLWPALRKYRRFERNPSNLPIANDEFERDLNETDQILQRSKEMLRGIVVSPTKFDLVQMLRRALAEIPFAAADGPETLEVIADPAHLQHAITEIISNSVKAQRKTAMPEILVSVEATIDHGAEVVRIVITDRGPGVPAEYKGDIFKDFFSYDSDNCPSTGLGLGMVRRVIRAHGGSVTENGIPGKGARFEIEFPRFVSRTEEAPRNVPSLDRRGQ